MKLPVEIIKCLELLPDYDRGKVYSALYAYIYSEKMPGTSISLPARLAFEFSLAILRPALNRRKRAEERRRAKEAATNHSTDEKSRQETAVPDFSKSNNMENIIKGACEYYDDYSDRRTVIFEGVKRLMPNYKLLWFKENGKYEVERIRT